jgi:hypothetical protein
VDSASSGRNDQSLLLLEVLTLGDGAGNSSKDVAGLEYIVSKNGEHS